MVVYQVHPRLQWWPIGLFVLLILLLILHSFLMVGGLTDELKMTLSEPELFRTLLTVTEKFEANGQTALRNSAVDLIVLLLTGGEHWSSSVFKSVVFGLVIWNECDVQSANDFIITTFLSQVTAMSSVKRRRLLSASLISEHDSVMWLMGVILLYYWDDKVVFGCWQSFRFQLQEVPCFLSPGLTCSSMTRI